MHLGNTVIGADLVGRFPEVIQATLPLGAVLSRDEVRTILKIAFLSAEIDLDEDPNEMSLLDLASGELWKIAGYEREPLPVVSPLPIPQDPEARSARVGELASQLTSTGARELAYVLAYLFTVSDLELAPVETALLQDLRRALRIEPDRAGDITTRAAELLTPGLGPSS